MVGWRPLLVLLLASFHLGLAGTAALYPVDFAWVPSYFDDDDGDFLPLLLSEQIPALAVPPRSFTPVLSFVAAVVAEEPTGRTWVASERARLRAPPRS